LAFEFVALHRDRNDEPKLGALQRGGIDTPGRIVTPTSLIAES
jgi:hypothetical protein